MKKKIGIVFAFISCSVLCAAQQVVSSGGYAKRSQASVDWIIGGSLADISGFDLNYFSSEQMKKLMEEAFSLNVYPNPASDLLNIEITPPDTGRMLLEVLDTQGKTLISKTHPNETLMKLDIKDLAEGVYYLKITQLNNDQLFRIEKIIKINN